MQQERLINNSS